MVIGVENACAGGIGSHGDSADRFDLRKRVERDIELFHSGDFFLRVRIIREACPYGDTPDAIDAESERLAVIHGKKCRCRDDAEEHDEREKYLDDDEAVNPFPVPDDLEEMSNHRTAPFS